MMYLLKKVLLSILVTSPGMICLSAVSPAIGSKFPSNAIAQANTQTLGQCVKELNSAYPYSVNSEIHFKHIQNCQNILSNQMPRESLGQCVESLNEVYPYSVNSETNNRHIQICSSLLQAQQSNSNQPTQTVPSPTTQPTVLIIPNPNLQQRPSGSPQSISDCMKRLMYERKLVCTRDRGCSQIPSEGFGGWQYDNARTQVSEEAAVQACQNAR